MPAPKVRIENLTKTKLVREAGRGREIGVIYVLASAVTISSLSATAMSLRNYFTRFHQLREVL